LAADFEKIIDMYGENPTDTRKLLPELQPYVQYCESLKTTVLRHPLVFQIPFLFSWKIANAQFTAKSRIIAADPPEKTVWFYERPYRIPRMDEIKDKISPETFRALWEQVWKDAEEPHQFGDVPLKLFKRAGFLTDDESQWANLPPVLTVYRGQEAGHKPGISWTLNPVQARFFARRYATPEDHPVVHEGMLHKKRVLAFFDGRKEQEVVVEPKHVTTIRTRKVKMGWKK
jgi:hypothetical protein